MFSKLPYATALPPNKSTVALLSNLSATTIFGAEEQYLMENIKTFSLLITMSLPIIPDLNKIAFSVAKAWYPTIERRIKGHTNKVAYINFSNILTACLFLGIDQGFNS